MERRRPPNRNRGEETDFTEIGGKTDFTKIEEGRPLHKNRRGGKTALTETGEERKTDLTKTGEEEDHLHRNKR